MEIEDDDFYAPEESEVTSAPSTSAPAPALKPDPDDLEEGEEEDEGGAMDEDDDDSDIDIITERKDGSKAPPPSQSRYSDIRNIPQRSTATDAVKAATPVKREESKGPSAAALPPVSMSQVDVNAIPIHKGTGKPITQVNIDEDLSENEKPWRKPGTDLSDYFNYGFDEFTWALYAARQEALRGEYSQEAVAQKNKKMIDDMNNMMMMGGMAMPTMGGSSSSGGGAAAAAASMPGMEGIPPEMQAMMQQMMASGMDPSQMDAASMTAMFAGMQGAGAAGQGGQGGQGQNFGGSGFGGGQGQGYGYDQQGMGNAGGGGGGRGGGGFGGRGRGGRRW